MANDREINDMSNILVGMFIHYLLYESKSTKSYATISSTQTNDIERRIAYMIKSMLAKIIKDRPEIASNVSRISMRYAQISVLYNYFGGNLWGRSNNVIQKYIKGYVTWRLRFHYFAGVEESAYPVKVESNNNALTFSMGKDFYRSDAEPTRHYRGSDYEDMSVPTITTPLKQKVRLLHASIVSIPRMFEDFVGYRENLRVRLLDDTGNSIRPEFRSNLLDLYLSFVESGTAAYMFRNNSTDPVDSYLKEINIMLKNLFAADLDQDVYLANTYNPDNEFLSDVIEIQDHGRYATATPDRLNRTIALRAWLLDICNLHGVEVVLINPAAPATVEAPEPAPVVIRPVAVPAPVITPVIVPEEVAAVLAAPMDEEEIAEAAARDSIRQQLLGDLNRHFNPPQTEASL